MNSFYNTVVILAPAISAGVTPRGSLFLNVVTNLDLTVLNDLLINSTSGGMPSKRSANSNLTGYGVFYMHGSELVVKVVEVLTSLSSTS